MKDGFLVVDGRPIRATAVKDPAASAWGDVGVDVVIESTGIFLTKETAEGHLRAGARRVIISAPAKDDTPVFVYGVNTRSLRGRADHLGGVVHDELPGAHREGRRRRLRHQARPDDDRPRHHRDPEDRRRRLGQGLAVRARHPGEHHPGVDGRREGGDQGAARR